MKLSFLYSVGLVSLPAVLGSHDITITKVYTDLTLFLADLAGLKCDPLVEDFSDDVLVDGVSYKSTNIGPTYIADGTFNDRFGFVNPAGFTRWTFKDCTRAFGAHFNLAEPGGPGSGIDVTILADDIEVGTMPGDTNGFWGFIADEDFKKVELTKDLSDCPGCAETYKMNDLRFCNTYDPDPGCHGDPHFSTWKGEHYEYHGMCDLELVSDPTFADGKGLSVHIRTEIVHTWSYIKNAAIRIGDDILEVQGGAEENRYWFNKVYQGELTTIGGFAVQYSKASSKQRLFKIDLGDGEELKIGTYKEFVRVDFKEPKMYLYENTVGLLADFNSGKKLARDGFNVIEDYNDFGQEWQVLPDGPKLFHEVAGPQLPHQTCVLPSELHAEGKRRRLGEVAVTEIEAERACAKVPVRERDACVFDVLATDDLDMAGAF
jgi:hypothetical protein